MSTSASGCLYHVQNTYLDLIARSDATVLRDQLGRDQFHVIERDIPSFEVSTFVKIHFLFFPMVGWFSLNFDDTTADTTARFSKLPTVG